jgi:hypothetical protein
LPNFADICEIGNSYLWKVPMYSETGSYPSTKVAAGEGLPAGPIIVQSPEGTPQVVTATSAAGTGGELIKPLGEATAERLGPRVESWMEDF